MKEKIVLFFFLLLYPKGNPLSCYFIISCYFILNHLANFIHRHQWSNCGTTSFGAGRHFSFYVDDLSRQILTFLLSSTLPICSFHSFLFGTQLLVFSTLPSLCFHLFPCSEESFQLSHKVPSFLLFLALFRFLWYLT